MMARRKRLTSLGKTMAIEIRNRCTGAVILTIKAENLRGANLSYVAGNLEQVKSIHTERWAVTYTADTMFIGCQTHPLTDWWGFDDRTINAMDVGALKWWRKWKPILQAVIEASPAEPTKTETEATT